jgi:cyclic beta-1,2-glucan synthetase
VLGFRVRGATLSVDPCIPRNWPSYSITFRYHTATYQIRVENPRGVSRGIVSVDFDGKPMSGPANIPLADDGMEHNLVVILG